MSFDWDLALKVISMAVSFGAAVFAVFATRRKDVDKKFESLDERLLSGARRMDRHDTRLSTIERDIAALPGKDDMHQLQLAMMAQTGELKEMRAVMEGNQKIMARLEQIVSRHEEHLLEGSKK
ncbi:DUF2730 family protein [Actibacterium sp.]|uniref:DUF2730 family protein n=1 Tax=Actibacterium sp. TaxID=1872125 RepID=UPI00356B385F